MHIVPVIIFETNWYVVKAISTSLNLSTTEITVSLCMSSDKLLNSVDIIKWLSVKHSVGSPLLSSMHITANNMFNIIIGIADFYFSLTIIAVNRLISIVKMHQLCMVSCTVYRKHIMQTCNIATYIIILSYLHTPMWVSYKDLMRGYRTQMWRL